ncbi:amidohydrolase [Nocardia sp. NPDC051570]|uniref:amidohydrolase n=1 Tax=Nocardia sp. NPDC051570 TaxID=3364324 RepID=UPI0037B33519
MSTQLLIGGRIYSASSPDATAMAVTDGMVVWAGADRPGRALYPEAEIVELDGAFVAPGFVDPHVHVTGFGLQLIGLDLAGARSLAQCLELIRDYAAGHDDVVLTGQGWDETDWPEQRPPTLAEIDAAVGPGRMAYLVRVDVHSAVVSTPMLEAVPQARTATGYTAGEPLRAAAHHLVRQTMIERLDRAQRDRARSAALDHAAAYGVVAVHECAGPEISGRADVAELLEFQHGVEVRAYWGEAVRSGDEAAALVRELGVHGLAGDLFVDGSIGSRTAWLRAPYADGGVTGVSYLDVDAVAAHVRACTEAGLQAGFHAIGDSAIDAVVQGFSRVAAEVGAPALAARGHRLEHAELLDADHIARLAEYGVIASVQPGFDAAWGGSDGMYARRLGAERAAALNPFAAMAAAGVALAIGSDAPVTALNPWEAVRAAAHHRTPGHQISPRAAFSAATRGAWRAGGVRDGIAGTLVPGAPASYAVWDATELVVAAASDKVQRWSTDPRSRVPGLPRLDPGTPAPTCLRTVHRGAVVYEA